MAAAVASAVDFSPDRVLEIADRPDVFVSVALTAWFRDAPQAVHVLCYGMTIYDRRWLQRHSHDVEVCAAYLREHSITCALVDPSYPVAAPLTARQRRRLAELFPVWCGVGSPARWAVGGPGPNGRVPFPNWSASLRTGPEHRSPRVKSKIACQSQRFGAH
jgi:hypothetical protein